MIKIDNVTKIYQTKSKFNVTALQDISLEFPSKGLFFVLGQSGCGKTTLLNILGGLDNPTTGSVSVDDQVIDKDLGSGNYRQNYVGFIFQEYNLLEDLNVFDNVSLAMSYPNKEERSNAVQKVLKEVELEGHEKRRINELSGGQKQRIAIARALAKNSRILLCDEPTGNLDSRTSKEIFDLLKKISKTKLVIIVTHNEDVAYEYAERVIRLSDGIVIEDKTLFIEDENSEEEIVEVKNFNRVSLSYKMKCGLNNLFNRKFKTSIAFLLLFLSCFATCIMQVILSYDSEHTMSKLLKDESNIIVVKNNESEESPGVSSFSVKYTLNNDFSKYMDSKNYSDGYQNIFGTFFIMDNENQGMLESKDFYFKNELTEGFAYVTDYFIDLKVNLDDFIYPYEPLLYKKYEDLNGAEVIYNDFPLFKIAGVIKTDYKKYYEEDGKVKRPVQHYTHSGNYRNEVDYKTDYNYKIFYIQDSTFENIDTGNRSFTFNSGQGHQTSIDNGSEISTPSNLYIADMSGWWHKFYTNTGYFGTNNEDNIDNDHILQELDSDEIVISGDLYNRIFSEEINWKDYDKEYINNLSNNTPLIDSLKHLNKKISISIKDREGNIFEINNRKVVGVTRVDKKTDNSYCVYGSKEATGLTNKFLSEHFVTELYIKNIKNKRKLLEALREDDILVKGIPEAFIYDCENTVDELRIYLIGATVIISLITLISLFNLVSSKINDKKKEIGILVAIGLKKSEINFIYLFSMICMMITSIILTIGTSYFMISKINISLIEEPFGFISYFNVIWLTYIVVILSCLILFLLSLYPLIRYTRKKPIDIIRN